MRVFKHFQDPIHAQALADGFVWLSTLEHCRRSEDKLRGDSSEGTFLYGSGNIDGTIEDPHVRRFTSMSGIVLCEGVHITFKDCTATQAMEDAYLISTAMAPYQDEALLDEFGRYCVEITNIDLFFHRVTKAIENHIGIVSRRDNKRVTYSETYYEGLAEAPGDLGFVKPPEIFGPQDEYRFLWTINGNHAYKDQGILVPRVAGLCKILPIT